jgi:hypothetical protein
MKNITKKIVALQLADGTYDVLSKDENGDMAFITNAVNLKELKDICKKNDVRKKDIAIKFSCVHKKIRKQHKHDQYLNLIGMSNAQFHMLKETVRNKVLKCLRELKSLPTANFVIDNIHTAVGTELGFIQSDIDNVIHKLETFSKYVSNTVEDIERLVENNEKR